MRFALPFSVEFGRDVCTRPRGSCASGPSSSLMAAPVCLFPCHRWSGSGRSSFNVLGMSWMAHGVDRCGDSKAWSCSSVLAGGLLPGVIVRYFSGPVRQCGGWWRSPVKLRGLGCVLCFLCNLQGLSCKKGLYCAPMCNINPFLFAKRKENEIW
jgi:hypothetical protein